MIIDSASMFVRFLKEHGQLKRFIKLYNDDECSKNYRKRESNKIIYDTDLSKKSILEYLRIVEPELYMDVGFDLCHPNIATDMLFWFYYKLWLDVLKKTSNKKMVKNYLKLFKDGTQ